MSKRVSRLFMIAAVCFLFGEYAFSQTQQATEQPKLATRLMHVNHVSAEAVAQALMPFTKYNLAAVAANEKLGTITISGSPETVAAMESMIRELDVPPPEPPPLRSVEITADLILALNDKLREEPAPARLESVLKQLRANFSYKSYQLIDSIVLRNKEGRTGATNGSASYPGTDKEARYRLVFRCFTTGDKTNKTVRLDNLSLSLDIPSGLEEAATKTGQSGYRTVAFDTNLELREGQQVVVGKTGVGNGSAMIAVISVKIIE